MCPQKLAVIGWDLVAIELHDWAARCGISPEQKELSLAKNQQQKQCASGQSWVKNTMSQYCDYLYEMGIPQSSKLPHSVPPSILYTLVPLGLGLNGGALLGPYNRILSLYQYQVYVDPTGRFVSWLIRGKPHSCTEQTFFDSTDTINFEAEENRCRSHMKSHCPSPSPVPPNI